MSDDTMIRPGGWRGAPVLIAVLLSLGTGALVGVAFSQQPAPSSRKTDERQLQSTNRPENGQNQHGASPTPTAVESRSSDGGEARQSAPDWWMIGLTALLVVVGVLQVWSVIWQNQIMNQQTTLIEGQMKAAAGAANAATAAAKASLEANQISRESLIADQRPWISIAVQVTGPISREAHPAATRHDWHLSIRCQLHNHGKTPATYVQIHPKLIPLTGGYFSGGVDENGTPQGELIEGTNVVKEVERACRSKDKQVRDFARQHGMGFGHVVFPGGDYSVTWRLPFPGEETPEPPGYMGQFVAVIGVTYNSTFDSPEDFRTGEAFTVWKQVGDQRLKFNGEDVVLDAIGFVRYPFGSGSLAS